MCCFKKIILPLFILSSFFAQLQAQESDPQPIRELGVGVRNFSEDFSLIYKKQVGDEKYYRYEGNLNLAYQQDILILNMSVLFALENRKYLSEKLKFVRGPGLGLSLLLVSEEASVNRISPSFNYQLGFQYDINENFYVGGSTFPGIFVSFIDENDSPFGLGLNANLSAQVSAIFRF